LLNAYSFVVFLLLEDISETALAKQYGITANAIPIAAEAASCGAPLAALTPINATKAPTNEHSIVITQKKVFIIIPLFWQR
jgi:mitochondrial fission protein ELM1